MAATSVAEQQLAQIPLLKDGRPTNTSGSSLISTVLEWLQKGVKAAFCVLDADRRAVFLGEDGKLFELRRPEAAQAQDGAGGDMPTPKEIFHGRVAWKLPDNQDFGNQDLSAVCITSTSKNVFVLDSKLQLFSETAAQGLSRCLPDLHVAQVACGLDHVLVLTTNGVVHSSGANNYGQLGLGNTTAVEVPEMKPISAISEQGFATSVACGASHSVAILCKGKASMFGQILDIWGRYPTPIEVESPVGAPVKAVCGANHTLFLTAAGRLAGFGRSNKNQLGKLGNQTALREMPFETEKGRPVDIFCHPKLDASVVLTETDELYVCGDVGELFNLEHPIPAFLHYQKPAVILGGTMVCMRPPTQTVKMPGFNEPEYCDIEIVPTNAAGQEELAGGKPAALELVPKLPKDSLRRLVDHAVSEGTLSPNDVYREYLNRPTLEETLQDVATPTKAVVEQAVTAPSQELSPALVREGAANQLASPTASFNEVDCWFGPDHLDVLCLPDEERGPSGSADPAAAGAEVRRSSSSEPESIFFMLDVIRKRSSFLWTMLQSELKGDISQAENRKKQVRLSKYPPDVLKAYGQYLHEDVVVTDAAGAIELLELAREYSDETGLAEQCARVARRLVREKDLPSCLRKCIELGHMALAVDLVKLQLSLGNCCDVLQVAEMGAEDDPNARYIRDIAMKFALAHLTEVGKSERYKCMDSSISQRMLRMSAESNLMKT